jgi:hypothetical protein
MIDAPTESTFRWMARDNDRLGDLAVRAFRRSTDSKAKLEVYIRLDGGPATAVIESANRGGILATYQWNVFRVRRIWPKRLGKAR